ncbi:hypothetical protein D3C76_1445680 [compost metagenome]
MRSVIQIRQDLAVWYLADQLLHQLADFAVLSGIALAEIEFWSDGQITLLRQAAAQILNMFMHAKDFLHHQHNWERPLVMGRFGDIGWQIVPL